MRPRARVLAGTLAVASLAVLALLGLASTHTSPSGRTAPSLRGEALAGPPLTSPIGDGRAKLVVFWASWCEPCEHEAPAVERFSQSLSGRGRVIGVDWSDALAGARSFIRRYGWTFTNVRDAEGTVGSAYHLTGLPTTFVLDARGRIRATLRGPQDEHSLAQALAAASSS